MWEWGVLLKIMLTVAHQRSVNVAALFATLHQQNYIGIIWVKSASIGLPV